ncbi:unnamed protein product, partial [marine sediment metagenome]
ITYIKKINKTSLKSLPSEKDLEICEDTMYLITYFFRKKS